MSAPSATSAATSVGTARARLSAVTVLVGVYLGISILTIIAAILFRNDQAIVNTAVWIRGSIVVITGALMFRFALRARVGNPRHYLRLRLVSAIMVVAIAVILATPGDFPLWMKIEQATCGVILLVVVILANGSKVRAAFSASKQPEQAAA